MKVNAADAIAARGVQLLEELERRKLVGERHAGIVDWQARAQGQDTSQTAAPAVGGVASKKGRLPSQ